jgi:hypothetical protein
VSPWGASRAAAHEEVTTGVLSQVLSKATFILKNATNRSENATKWSRGYFFGWKKRGGGSASARLRRDKLNADKGRQKKANDQT